MSADNTSKAPPAAEQPPASPAASTSTSASTVPNSKNQDKNEAKRRAKLEKFAAKQAAQKAAAAAAAAAGNADGVAKKKEKKAKEARSAPEASAAPAVVTPEGEKKDMSQPMASSYNPNAVEASWYSWWEKQGFFEPQTGPNGEISPKGKFVMATPPPNVTGKLHIGHALFIAIQDSIVRWNRMRGVTTLFVPGSDHAGISTQVVVENQLMRQEGLTRHDIGREALVERVWEWKHEYGNAIMSQIRKLGGSYDWSRERFTLDEMLSRATYETFVRMYDDGIIYRSNRLVNWCHKLNTTLSNLEVEDKEIKGRTMMSVPGYPDNEKFEFGVLVHFSYQVENSDERITVATTRIETMLGDTAIAVHPDDKRYKHLHGKYVVHPFVDRRIPIITDAEGVEMEFGTGAVKITPAHDFNDYKMGTRHNLEFINLLNEDGTYNENAGPYAGMKRFHVRRQIIGDLKDKGLYVDTTENPMILPTCVKSGDIIEPMIKPQWWVKCKGLAEPAMEAVRDGRLEIVPQTSEAEWFRWLGDIQDWCVSRQLWWGHRIPAYFVRIAGQTNDPADEKYWVVGRDAAEAQKRAAEKFPGVEFELEQDPDVLDTWFSSGLWPFAVLGWPENTEDFKKYYPTSLLETGWDILFFWVARMVMLGMYLTGEVPFSKVFCHAMVRDALGRKMSKSLGNVVDPLDVINGISLADMHAKLENSNLDPREVKKAKLGQTEDFPNGIPECGTDALRFALCSYTSAGRSVNLNILRVDGYRKFCNKLWNATRFALMKLGDDFVPTPEATVTGKESLAERWILQRLNIAARDLNAAMADMNLMSATSAIHSFLLHDLCDVYIEYIKPITTPEADPEARASAQQTLYTCLDQGLKMLHPFMPFVTEELWQRLPHRATETKPSISLTEFPEPREDYEDAQALADFDFVMNIAKAGRSLTADYNVLSKSKFYISNTSEASYQLTSAQASGIATMIKGCESVTVLKPEETVPAGCAVFSINDEVNMYLLVRGSVDIDKEVSKIEKNVAKTTKLRDALIAKTKIEKYETTVPAEVREANASKISNYDAEIEALEAAIKTFLTLKNAE
ncbi:valine--tRNA ligase [Coemansia sp. Benny D115]|nr:valine--tRNA ligase [Coemansia sp. Benny D115]